MANLGTIIEINEAFKCFLLLFDLKMKVKSPENAPVLFMAI